MLILNQIWVIFRVDNICPAHIVRVVWSDHLGRIVDQTVQFEQKVVTDSLQSLRRPI